MRSQPTINPIPTMLKLTHTLPTLLLAAVAFASTANNASAQENNNPPEGFTALFNGQDTDNWTGGTTRNPQEINALSENDRQQWDDRQRRGIEQHWSVDNGELVSDGHEPHLVTSDDYSDFELYVDWKIQTGGDSGIYLRGCPQIQIWDPTHVPAHRHGSNRGSGGLWNNSVDANKWPSEVADNPIGQWNRMHVVMVGQYVTVTLNDIKIVDNVPLENYYNRSIPVFMAGPIHLQTHGNEVRFRNVFVREIDAEEANQYLADMNGDDDTFTSLFNGEDLEGWIGATDNYEVVDGAIQCIQGRGGNLITQDRFDNFTVRVEFKLPPGGNNGLAIRTPNAQTNPAHQAIELQVLDNTADKYANLEPYQFHGSAYTIAAAHRGYLRPVGQWNYQEVIVDGDHIQVFLNGYQILDTHLQEDKPNHPGASRTEGHFGFCGHHDPVAFRNIRIREIE